MYNMYLYMYIRHMYIQIHMFIYTYIGVGLNTIRCYSLAKLTHKTSHHTQLHGIFQ